MILVGSLVGYLLVVMGIGALVNRLLLPIFGRGWRLFVAPGVVAHELAHALACVVTGAPVLDINFWKASGGHVIHGPPRLHIIGPVFISFAPMILMTLGLFVFVPVLSPGLANLTWTQHVPSSLTQLVGGYLASLILAIKSFDWRTITPWLLTYAMLNVAVTMTPSGIDLKNAQWAFAACLIVAALIGRLLAVSVSAAVLWPPAATSLILLGMALIVAVIIAVLARLVRR